MTLPDERIPFPVESRYSVRPTMRRWDAGDRGHLRLDRRYPEYLREKLRLLRDDAAGCRVPAPDVDRAELRGALVRVAEELAADAARSAKPGLVSEPAPHAAPVAGPDALPDARPDAHPDAAPAPIVADGAALHFPLLGISLARPDLRMAQTPPGLGIGGLPRPLRDRARAHLAGLGPLERLADALALAVQEDLVLMNLVLMNPVLMDRVPVDRVPVAGPGATGGAAGATIHQDAGPARGGGPGALDVDGRAELLHVCFPSSWDPAARAGAGFAALHAPVPHGETLRAAAGRVVRAMVDKGPFVRYVWSLAGDAALDQNPRRRAATALPAGPGELWFRVERQTVLPLQELRRALFTIRVYRAPLPAVLTSPERRRVLASALRSMDEALLAYKGVGGLRSELLAYLERP